MMIPEENRNITHTASAIMIALMTGTFAAVWLLFYNQIVFRTHQELGTIAFIFVWFALYIKFAQTYCAFKIASSSIFDTAFSQFLSVGFADLILYIAGCLAARRYINILPGVVAVLAQALIGFLWASAAKQYFLSHVGPRKCLLLYDSNISDQERVVGKTFAQKLEQHYGHLFHIVERCPIDENLDTVYAQIAQYPVVFLYELPLEKRSKITRYCVDTGKRLYVTPTVEDVIARGYDVKHFIDTPLFAYNGSFKVNQTYFGKRTLDILMSTLTLVVASPIMLVVAIAIKLEDGGAGDIIGTTKKSAHLCGFSMA